MLDNVCIPPIKTEGKISAVLPMKIGVRQGASLRENTHMVTELSSDDAILVNNNEDDL